MAVEGRELERLRRLGGAFSRWKLWRSRCDGGEGGRCDRRRGEGVESWPSLRSGKIISGFVSVGDGGTWGMAPQVVRLTMACGRKGGSRACNRWTNAIRDVLAGVDHGDADGRGQSCGVRRGDGRMRFGARAATARSRPCGRAFFRGREFDSSTQQSAALCPLPGALRGQAERARPRPSRAPVRNPHLQRPTGIFSTCKSSANVRCVPGFHVVALLVLPTASVDHLWAWDADHTEARARKKHLSLLRQPALASSQIQIQSAHHAPSVAPLQPWP